MDMTHTIIEEVNLWFQEGSSDKVYWAAIVKNDLGYSVGFSYGRRGGTMKEGYKNESPVSLDEAKKIFNKLVGEKLKKGYLPS